MDVSSLKLSGSAVIFAIVAVILLVLGAVLFIPSSDEGTRRLGLVMSIASPTLMIFLAMVRSDKTATSTEKAASNLENGYFDDKINAAVQSALQTHNVIGSKTTTTTTEVGNQTPVAPTPTSTVPLDGNV